MRRTDRRWAALLILIGSLLPAPFASSAPDIKVVQSGKATTALIAVPGRGFGTAFCIDSQGVFVTNEHVIRGLRRGMPVLLVLNPAQKDERVIITRVVKYDRTTDLALLVADAKYHNKPYPVLKIGKTDKLVETQEVIAFGYPFGTALRVSRRDFPAISVNVGRITALRRNRDSSLASVQLDAQVNEGNSGGPVLDDKGEVVGVIKEGIPGRGVNFAIPAELVREFVNPVEIMFAPPVLSTKTRHKQVQLEVMVIAVDEPEQDFDVSIEFKVEGLEPRTVQAKRSKDGVYRVMTTLVPKNKNKLDLRQATFTATVKKSGETLATQRGLINLDGSPEAVGTAKRPNDSPPVALPTHPPTKLPDGQAEFDEPSRVIELPESAAQHVVGGAGRYLLMHLKASRKVVVLDLTKGEPAFEVTNVADDVLIAAGREQFVLVFPGQTLMQRWSFETQKREKVARVTTPGPVRLAIMGENSKGPLLIAGRSAQLYDLKTLKRSAIEGRVIGEQGSHPAVIRVSADGRVFTAIPSGIGPVAYGRMLIADGRTHIQSFGGTSHAYRWAQPTADGRLMLMKDGFRIYNSQLQLVETKSLNKWTTYATVDPRWFIAARFEALDRQGNWVTRVNFCTVANRQVVHTYTGLREIAPVRDYNTRASIEMKLHRALPHLYYIPWADLLVTLTWDRKRVFIRRFNLVEALNATGIDYLFIQSVPPTTADAGKRFKYKVEVVSKSDKLTYQLESGPEGMTISPKGVVSWKVPANTPPEPQSVIILVTDGEGQEVFHTFDLHINAKQGVVRVKGGPAD